MFSSFIPHVCTDNFPTVNMRSIHAPNRRNQPKIFWDVVPCEQRIDFGVCKMSYPRRFLCNAEREVSVSGNGKIARNVPTEHVAGVPPFPEPLDYCARCAVWVSLDRAEVSAICILYCIELLPTLPSVTFFSAGDAHRTR